LPFMAVEGARSPPLGRPPHAPNDSITNKAPAR
jgi:hypothetical protein